MARPLPPKEWRFLLLVATGGVLLRLLWLARLFDDPFAALGSAEASAVALAFARTGTLADAYFPGQGATAHLMPVNPALAGYVLRAFGPEGTAAHAMLLAWSLAQVLGAYLLFHLLGRRCGVAPAAARWGAAFLCLAPVFVPQETIDFRYWEGATALLLAGATMLLLPDGGEATGRWRAAATGAGVALAGFVAPPIGVAVAGAAAVAFAHAPRRAGVALTAALTLVAVLTGLWSARNAAVLGTPVPTRSNLGIELALANHDRAVAPANPAAAFHARLAAIHPAASATAQAAVRGHGEVAYSQMLQREALEWIAAHPAGFATLAVRHAGEFLFPRPWQFHFTGWEGMRGARALGTGLPVALGLSWLFAASWRRRPIARALLAYVLLLAAQFAFFQPMPRYTYLVFVPLAFPAAEAVRLFFEAAGRRIRQIGQPPHLASAAHDGIEDQARETG